MSWEIHQGEAFDDFFKWQEEGSDVDLSGQTVTFKGEFRNELTTEKQSTPETFSYAVTVGSFDPGSGVNHQMHLSAVCAANPGIYKTQLQLSPMDETIECPNLTILKKL